MDEEPDEYYGRSTEESRKNKKNKEKKERESNESAFLID